MVGVDIWRRERAKEWAIYTTNPPMEYSELGLLPASSSCTTSTPIPRQSRNTGHVPHDAREVGPEASRISSAGNQVMIVKMQRCKLWGLYCPKGGTSQSPSFLLFQGQGRGDWHGKPGLRSPVGPKGMSIQGPASAPLTGRQDPPSGN